MPDMLNITGFPLFQRRRKIQTEVLPKYSFTFFFEDDFDYDLAQQWMVNNWTLAIYLGVAYLIMVFGGRKFMANRRPVYVRWLMFIWNFILFSFSLIAFIRSSPEMVHVLKQSGLHGSFCDNTAFYVHRYSCFWYSMFSFSKAPELLDTFFLVLMKRKIVFLHWYHHLTTLCFTWYIFKEGMALGRWYTFMNLMVHAIMYGYFGLRTLRVKIPRIIAKSITTMQIVQMVFGLIFSVYAFAMKITGVPCAVSFTGGLCAVLLYSGFMLLFIRFFIDSYISTKSKRQSAVKKD